MGEKARRTLIVRSAVRSVVSALALVAAAIVVVYAASAWRMRARIQVAEHPLVVTADSLTLARGRHLVATRGCAACHGADFGGRVLLRNPLIGTFTAPNITSAGAGAALSDADWERAVRHGGGRDGRPLVLMPAQELAGLADDDLAAIVAYLRTVPPTARTVTRSVPGPIARLMLVTGKMTLLPSERVDHAAPHPRTMSPAPTPTYGAYLAAGCVSCHGERLVGGRIPGAPPSYPPATNLTPVGLGHWSEQDFRRAMREGRRPDGSRIRPPMPFGVTRELTDVEIAALWRYLRALPPEPTGTR